MPLWIIEVITVLICPSRRIGDLNAGKRVINVTDIVNSNPSIDFKKVFMVFILDILLMAGMAYEFSGNSKSGCIENTPYPESLKFLI